MGSPYWVKVLINKTFSQRFFWSRMSNYPVVGKIIDKVLFEGDDIIYLPRDETIPINKNLAAAKEDLVLPSQVLEHFIKSANFHWRMDFCICRDSSECKDYPRELGCLFLGEAAKGINPKFGRQVTTREALDHAARCRDAGLVHLIGRNKLDTAWLNVGPGKKLLTICNCCPCCCLWKILPIISGDISTKVNRMPGVSVKVTDECVGCGTCTKNACFVDAVHLEDDRAVIGGHCRGCGQCAIVCPVGAIEVTIDDPRRVSDTIAKISSLVEIK